MFDEIFAKFNELKAILTEFNASDKTESDKFIEDTKAKIKELSEVVEKSKETPGE